MGVFENAIKNIDKIANEINLSDKDKTLLLSHKRIKHEVLQVDGKDYPAWRILHNEALGPGKGGIRFHPNVNEDEVKSLSFWMSLKNSLVGLPYGGAKGGVVVNPKELDNKTIEKISREYIKAFHEYLGQDKDIPAPDVYTNSQIMSWMLDEFEKIKGHHEPGMITGKPIELGGCVLRSDATAEGGRIIIHELLNKINKKPQDLRVAIQGFGNAGMLITQKLYDDKFKIISVSDSKGAITNENGLNITELINHKKETKSVINFKDSKTITNKELLEKNVDLLVLAALENQITKENANEIKAKYIVELANGPISSDADDVLFEKDIIVIPDILANAGGVFVSYLEWTQNKNGHIMDVDYLKNVFENRMKESFNKVFNQSREKSISNRSSAYIIAVQRIMAAEKLRGN